MASFRHSIDIAATPDEVWKVLGDVTSVVRWIPGVTGVVATDSGRVCTFEDGHVQNEQILDYSEESRSYRYVIEGAPLPVANNTGSFAVEANGRQSRVVWESSFVALDPAAEDALSAMWEPYLPMILTNLKSVVEAS